MFNTQWRFDPFHPLIREHRVFGDPVLPFSVWLVKCLEAVTEFQGQPPTELKDVTVREMMRFRSAESIPVQFLAAPMGVGAGRFEVRPDGANGKAVAPIAEGAWRADRTDDSPAIGAGTGSFLDRGRFYETAKAAGLEYGPLYQRVAGLEVNGETWAAQLAAGEHGTDRSVEIPVLWDALLQCGAVLAGDGTACWVPHAIERVRLQNGGGEVGRVAGHWTTDRSPQEGRRIANVRGFAVGSDTPSVEFIGVHYGQMSSTNGIQTSGPDQTQEAAPMIEQLRSASPDDRRALLVGFIEEQLLQVLKWDNRRRSELARGFVAIGLDSLMSVDLQFRLQTSLKFALKPGQGLNLPSIPALADFLLQKHLQLG